LDRMPHGPIGTVAQSARHEQLVTDKIEAEIAAAQNGPVGIAGLSWETLDRMPHGPAATVAQSARHDRLVAAKRAAEIH
ncbi:MAG: hypothetical protein WCJ92_07250, partial [Alphaproteobacteria bacterium]